MVKTRQYARYRMDRHIVKSWRRAFQLHDGCLCCSENVHHDYYFYTMALPIILLRCVQGGVCVFGGCTNTFN